MNIEKLFHLSKKTKKYVIGLMSGTSLDGVDVVLLQISGSGTKTKLNQIAFEAFPFPDGLKKILIENSTMRKGNVTDICRLNFLISQIYFDAVNYICKKNKFPFSKIDLIGSHGQTIHHLPVPQKMYGYNVASTLQIGDPSVISKLTGIITVGDFRTGDVALGGQGAPLVPYFDYIMFHSNKLNRALLNIGGIANITILNKKGTGNDVLAFDTGPGNMMIDFLVQKFFNVEYDKDGKIASSGKLNEELFSALIKKDNYIEIAPPKSTGREYYGKEFLSLILRKFKNLNKEDWITTVTSFTAYAVYRNYEKYISNETIIDELFVSGGGAKNKFLVNQLSKYFGKSVLVKKVEKLGISSDAKEAICFAVLANETISGNPSNIPRVTGAREQTILGKICL